MIERCTIVSRVFSLLFIVALFGCSNAMPQVPEVTKTELAEAIESPTGQYSTMWEGLFYTGTSGGYHYVRLCRKGQADEVVRIKEDALAITPVVPYPAAPLRQIEVSKIVLETKR